MSSIIALVLVTLGLGDRGPIPPGTADELARPPGVEFPADAGAPWDASTRGACELIQSKESCGYAKTCFWAQGHCLTCPGYSRCGDEDLPIWSF